nr:DNA methyltransferase [Rhodoplanes roseus]
MKHHITGKPVELMAGLLAAMEGPVLDPFMGSGTVGVACVRRGLPYVGIELGPACFEVACRRLGDEPSRDRPVGLVVED